jgi:prephenate dehydratase
MIVAYQGEPGAFSEDAARQLVPGAETLGFGTFDETFSSAQFGAADAALIPVENSISGAVPRVYDLLWGDPAMQIVDEIVYRVVQNLIGTNDATLDCIHEVRSHPVALEQCRIFLAQHPQIASTVVPDTAGAVREIIELGDSSVGAIASTLAAERYGARVLVPAIQDVEDNFTRFFLIRRYAKPVHAPKRACLALVLAHRPGSLRDALSAIADQGLNLRTIASRPAFDAPFTYRFYLEIEDVETTKLDAALAHIDGTTRILGTY